LKILQNKETSAQWNLGELYLNGDGVEQDYSKAHEWFVKSAEQGNSNAQCSVVELYDMGYGDTRY